VQIQSKTLKKKKLKLVNIKSFYESDICLQNAQVSAPDIQYRYVTPCNI